VRTDPDDIRRFLNSRNRIENIDPSLVKAGVMLLFYRRADTLHVLLTKRTSDVEHHKNQISFPGGSADTSDADIVQTALRETREEIGIPPELIDVLGVFDDVWTPSGFRITPVIGFLPSLPQLVVNSGEVEEILEVPVSFFMDESNAEARMMSKDGMAIRVYFYRYGNNEIWGATAAMLRSFLLSFQEYTKSGGPSGH